MSARRSRFRFLLGLAGLLPLAIGIFGSSTLNARQAQPATPAPQVERSPESYGLLLRGEEAEAFLRTAQVIKKKAIGVGITNPQQLTLADGTRTLKAVWKTIDESKRGVTTFAMGGFEIDFRDTYKFEVAAYELDKLLGLELVPPTVERQIKDETGSLQLWVEGCTTEFDRRKRDLPAPDVEAWNRQMYRVRLFHQLCFNTDRANIRNILVDPDFRIYAVDNSRAFRTHDQLPEEKDLTRFSRAILERLKGLDRSTLSARLGRWLTNPEINGLLKRRDRILGLVERRVAEAGEVAVLYP